MHRSEADRLVSCSDCGQDFLPGPDRGFRFGDRGALCWDCATRRGGVYDETHEHWQTPPRIDDLGPEYD